MNRDLSRPWSWCADISPSPITCYKPQHPLHSHCPLSLPGLGHSLRCWDVYMYTCTSPPTSFSRAKEAMNKYYQRPMSLDYRIIHCLYRSCIILYMYRGKNVNLAPFCIAVHQELHTAPQRTTYSSTAHSYISHFSQLCITTTIYYYYIWEQMLKSMAH